jgi:hypothetical protein
MIFGPDDVHERHPGGVAGEKLRDVSRYHRRL